MSDKSAERAAAGRRAIEKRWAPYRAARLAAGLPATKGEARGRKPDKFDDPEIEAHYLAAAEDAGLFPEKATSQQRRRIAYRYAEAVTAELERKVAERPDATLSSADERIAYYEAEIRRLDAADAADVVRAEARAKYRVEIEDALTDVLFREGRL